MKKNYLLFILCCIPFLLNAQVEKLNIFNQEKQVDKKEIVHQEPLSKTRVIPALKDTRLELVSFKPLTQEQKKSMRADEATVILTANDVWGDGSGYQLLIDTDATAYGTIIPTVDSGVGSLTVSDYSDFEYTIPENADPALTTPNVVVTGAQSITIPAGTYDYVVVNPTPGDRLWIASNNCDPGRADDFTFQAGFEYTFALTSIVVGPNTNDCVTITEEGEVTEPTIKAVPTSLGFFTFLGEASGVQTSTITSALLTANITAATAAPFEISANGTTYGTTATLPSDGGVLYVRYQGTTAGDHTGTVTLNSTGAAQVVISLTGTTVDCSAALTLPVFQGFEDVSGFCWRADRESSDQTAESGLGVASGASYSAGSYCWQFTTDATSDGLYNQYAISPELPTNTGVKYMSAYFCEYNGIGEDVAFGYSTTTDDVSAFTWLETHNIVGFLGWIWEKVETYNIPGNAKYVAIKYMAYGPEVSYFILADDIEVKAITDAVSAFAGGTSWAPGAVDINATTTSGDFTIKNVGVGTLTVSNVSTLSAPWSTTFNSGLSLTQGQEHTSLSASTQLHTMISQPPSVSTPATVKLIPSR